MKNLNILLFSILIVGAFNSSYAENAPDLVDYFADNGFGYAVGAHQHPSGEHYKGVTYLAYQGPAEDPYVASYNHKTGKARYWFRDWTVIRRLSRSCFKRSSSPFLRSFSEESISSFVWRCALRRLTSLDNSERLRNPLI